MMYHFLFYFLIYAFIGWCGEVVFAALKTGTFVNRGFLNGPLCPIYGFGACIVIFVLSPVQNHMFFVVVGSIVLTTLLEFFTGWLLQKLFHERWWDYSDQPFNIRGYVCLKASLGWGLVCFFLFEYVHVPVKNFVAWLPHTLGIVLLCLFYIYLAADLVTTLLTIRKIKVRSKEAEILAKQLHNLSENLGAKLAESSLSVSAKARQSQTRIKAETEKYLVYNADGKVDAEASRRKIDGLIRESREQARKKPFGQRRLSKAFPRLAKLWEEGAQDNDEYPDD